MKNSAPERMRALALKIYSDILSREHFKPKFHVRSGLLAPPPLSHFTNLEPLWSGHTDDENWWLFRPEECSPHVLWPIDAGLVTDQGGEEQDLILHKTESITAKEVRGIANRFSPYMVKVSHAQMLDGKLASCSWLYAWFGGKWCQAEKRIAWHGRDAENVIPEFSLGDFDKHGSEQVGMAIALSLRQRYEWAVCIGADDLPSIRFATDPTGIHELFKTREANAASDRRDALISWISNHWRKNRFDPETEVYVRKHLRGQTDFDWHGFSCRVRPAQYDLDKRDALAVEREAMRITGKDRRKAG